MAYITSWYWNKGDFRKVNEDSFTLQRVRARKKELIFAAVCDGIGGLRAGECASGLVAEQLTEWFYREGFWKMRSLFWTKRWCLFADADLYWCISGTAGRISFAANAA